MALGGGTFVSFNKVLPGTYANFRSKVEEEKINFLGYVGLAQEFYGASGMKCINASDIRSDDNYCLREFGFSLESTQMTWLRELLKGGAQTIYVYNTLTGGTQAKNTYATAKYAGTRGNDIKITIETQLDSTFDVVTYLDNKVVDTQNVTKATELISNDYVTFSDTALTDTSNAALTGGTDGTVNNVAHENFLNEIETIYTNVVICTAVDDTTKALYVQAACDFIENTGNKTLFVLHKAIADYPSIYNVDTCVTANGTGANGIIYWFGGKLANADYNTSLTNKIYDGELEIADTYTQTELIAAIKNGKIVLHKVGEKYNILKEVTAHQTVTKDLNKDFKIGQHVRIVFGVLIQQATVFNELHLGITQGNPSGEAKVYTAMTAVLDDFAKNGCLEYVSDDISVEKVDKESVRVLEAFTTAVAIDKLYLDATVD